MPFPSVTPPATIAANSSWTSAVTNSQGFSALTVGVTSSQPGALYVTRYVDGAGAVVLDNPANKNSATLVATVGNSVALADGVVYGSFTITITNTAASSATITAVNPGWVCQGP